MTLAEREQHHPALHLGGSRRLWIEISTHAISDYHDGHGHD
jgi:pterin-4a-carbinolamine dehydratase